MDKISQFFKKNLAPSSEERLWNQSIPLLLFGVSIVIIAFAGRQWDWFIEDSNNGEAIRSIALTIAAIWGIYGVKIAIRRTIVLKKQADSQIKETKALEKQVSLQEKGQVSKRYVRALELLASDKQHIKMAGIFILERVAKEADDKTFEDILISLCAYIRDAFPHPAENDPDIPSPFSQREDMREILKFLSAESISEKLEEMTPLSDIGNIIDLSRTNLKGALFVNAYLNGVNFLGSCLKNADFSVANLRSASFFSADIEGANFIKADLHSAIFFDAKNIEKAKSIKRARNLQYAKGLETVKGIPPDYFTKGTNG